MLASSQGFPWRWGLWACRGLRAALGPRAQQLEGEGDSAGDWPRLSGSSGGGAEGLG